MPVKTLADFPLASARSEARPISAKAAVERAEYAKLSAFPNVGAD